MVADFYKPLGADCFRKSLAIHLNQRDMRQCYRSILVELGLAEFLLGSLVEKLINDTYFDFLTLVPRITDPSIAV